MSCAQPSPSSYLSVLIMCYSYKMFEPNMDDYLDDEMDELKRAFEVICKEWERSVSITASSMVGGHIRISVPPQDSRTSAFAFLFRHARQATLNGSQSQTQATPAQSSFIGSQNPALMKRNVLASFTDVLLLPVTIVPRAVGAGVEAVGAIGTGVGAAIGTGVGAVGTGVVQGIAMLNPQRWVGNVDGGAGTSVDLGVGAGGAPGNGYESFGKDGALFEVGEDEDDLEDADADAGEGGILDSEESGVAVGDEAGWGEIAVSRMGENGPIAGGFDASAAPKRTSLTSDAASITTVTTATSIKDPARFSVTTAAPSIRSRASIEALDLLLSLDVSLELIHATRDAMKRLETFAGYPGAMGTRVRETLEEAFCEMLGALGSRHVAWGFGM